MKTVRDLEQALEKYNATFRRKDLPPLETSGIYDLFPEDHGHPEDVERRWPNSYQYAERRGVYAILDGERGIRYLGKASMGSRLGGRLGSYFMYAPDGSKKCHVKHKTWVNPPEYVITIAVPDAVAFEAAALEEFLIQELDPPENATGRRNAR